MAIHNIKTSLRKKNTKMALWSSRSFGYKLGVSVLFLSSAFYLIGYASPNWYSFRYGHAGLWQICSRHMCRSAAVYFSEGWFKVVQTLQSLGLIGLFISCVIAIVENCCQTTSIHCRCLEFNSSISGLTGFVGAMVFVGKTNKYLSLYYGWAFGLNLTGCILIMFTAIGICFTNHSITDSADTSGTIIQAGQAPVTVQQGQNYPCQGQTYTPPGQSYLPQRQGYPPQGQGYLPHGQGYPPQRQDYPPQGQGYPPQIPSCPPPYGAQPGYSSSQSYSDAPPPYPGYVTEDAAGQKQI